MNSSNCEMKSSSMKWKGLLAWTSHRPRTGGFDEMVLMWEYSVLGLLSICGVMDASICCGFSGFCGSFHATLNSFVVNVACSSSRGLLM